MTERSEPDAGCCPDGPMLLRGSHVVVDEDGHQHHTRRPVSAVCRCGHTAIKPWCDGTHKVAQKTDRSPLRTDVRVLVPATSTLAGEGTGDAAGLGSCPDVGSNSRGSTHGTPSGDPGGAR